ncbi:hypothetical protein ACF1D2_29640 [Streptomyces bacillaris]|uniref:hypothetical protein n=1 Tax=Streptomyces bacillaris TaxID=68179 RepID=UPI0036FC1D83
MTDTSGIAARISALSTGPWAGPVGPPPEGLDLAWVWQIPVGTVRVETYSPVEAEILEARLTDPSGRARPEAGPPVTAEDGPRPRRTGRPPAASRSPGPGRLPGTGAETEAGVVMVLLPAKPMLVTAG